MWESLIAVLAAERDGGGWMISNPKSPFRISPGSFRQNSEWKRPFVGEEMQVAVRDASSPRQDLMKSVRTVPVRLICQHQFHCYQQ